MTTMVVSGDWGRVLGADCWRGSGSDLVCLRRQRFRGSERAQDSMSGRAVFRAGSTTCVRSYWLPPRQLAGLHPRFLQHMPPHLHARVNLSFYHV